MPLSVEKLELIRTAAETAARRALTTMGIDADNPIEVQKDMAHLRASRYAAVATKKLVRKTIVPIIVVGAAMAIWEGFGEAISDLLSRTKGG